MISPPARANRRGTVLAMYDRIAVACFAWLLVQTSEPVPVLWEGGIKNAYPHWSADGSKILYQSNAGGRWQLLVMDKDGSHRTPLTKGDCNDNFPDWSPDGERIAFVSDRDGNEDIWVMAADGSGARNLTSHPARDIHPYWSADGAKILFNSTRDVDRLQIYELDPSTGEVQRLVESKDDDTCARVSPDGERIAYLTNLATGRDDVMCRQRDGSDPVNLTEDAAADGWPSWTPDGKRIVYCSRVQGAFALHVMDADGTQRRQLTTPPPGTMDARPHVSPDGKWLVFNRERGDTIGIMTMPLPARGSA
jgi:tol-pal system beta propeller repeat protein TolB